MKSLGLKAPIAIIGLGLSGRSVLMLLLHAGFSREDLLLFDQKESGADFQNPEDLLKKNPRTLVVSPGVPLSLPWIQQFRLQGGEITSELAIATYFLTTEKVLGVTGSIGKSTCTALLGAGLHEFSPHSFVGGNLGRPLADYALRKRQGDPVAEWVVLELSSYQLENYANLDCQGCLITYLAPNHLERYPDLETYYETKWTLVQKTKGPLVLNKNGGDLFSFAAKKSGSFTWTSGDDSVWKTFDFSKASLVGDHNRDNLALVMRLARTLGWPESSIEGFLRFSGLPHRLENLGHRGGVQFINDSKSTTIDSVLQAVKSTQNLCPGTAHLLLGGKDKNLPWRELSSLASPKRRFYFFGEVGEKARGESGLSGARFARLAEAVDSVLKDAVPGDLVLLSPGGTSLDEFRSFEERGDFFKNRISKR